MINQRNSTIQRIELRPDCYFIYKRVAYQNGIVSIRGIIFVAGKRATLYEYQSVKEIIDDTAFLMSDIKQTIAWSLYLDKKIYLRGVDSVLDWRVEDLLKNEEVLKL